MTKIPDHRLECIAKGTEDYDGEDVSCMSAELWKLRAEQAAWRKFTEEANRTVDRAEAERDALREALESIMHAVKTPPWTNMSRADMREIARAALAAQERKP